MTQNVRSRTGSFVVAIPMAEAVPLFTAEGERRWVRGWDPEILSGTGERGSAFATRAADGRRTTWIVAHADPAQGRVSYARLVEGLNIGLVDVDCRAVGDATQVTVTYSLTALSFEGSRLAEEFLEPARYARMMEDWAALIAARA